MFGTLALSLALVTAPVALVDPFVGTSGTQAGGPIDTFPGADVPFGMVQWSPDTPSQDAGGGYDYGDKAITGFSLTHLSGPGCSVFGDFGMLPTLGAIADPATAKQPFTHQNEVATPGSYAVSLGDPAIRTDLTVTQHTGIGTFTFPPDTRANLLVNVASNQAGVTNAGVHVDSPTQLSGWASSGFFCGMPDAYTVYFVARFNRPFASFGTWKGSTVTAGARASGGPQSGAFVTFDTTHDPVVVMKVGLSFVDTAGAAANLAAEDPGWNQAAVAQQASAQWSGMLARLSVTGGTMREQQTFYTALYHTLLHPNVISDADGRYRGFDGRIHRVAAGHKEYANFSDWDVYRSEIPLLALLAPGEASDMMQSLVDAAHQEGWLPRWALVNGPTSVMGGDSMDPVIAGAYAFGARDFNARAALQAMIKGASTTGGPPAQGWYVERWELDDDYLHRGYVVNTHTTSVAPEPNGASETLEYALDDFSIARFARSLGERAVYDTFMHRSSNWATLFDTATGLIAGRDAAGAFMQTPLEENGQSGFQEGNAAQYTWMVPQDLRDLIAGMGGDAAAAAKLDTFFTHLNAGQSEPYAWLGNEPSLGSPWVYLSLGQPWKTQRLVRRAIATLYGPTPDGLPGNDDLGEMSSWYVWSAIGLYPQNPSVRILDVGSPLFTGVTLASPGGATIAISAPAASTATPYVQSLRVDGIASDRPWIALPAHRAIRLDFDLGSTPNRAWGSAAGDAPPSYASSAVHFAPATAASLTAPSFGLSAGGSFQTRVVLNNSAGNDAANVHWQVTAPPGLRIVPTGGSVSAAPKSSTAIALTVSADSSAGAGFYDVPIDASAANGALLQRATLIVRVAGGVPHPIAYAENRFGNTVTPLDLTTGAVGPEIAAGEQPRDAVLGRDGSRLYVADFGATTVNVIDTGSLHTIATVNVGHAPNGIALTPDGTTLWVANNGDATVQPIDTATLKAGTPIAVGLNPRAIAISPDGAMLYVTDSGSNTVTPVDLKTKTAQAPIPVGARPFGIAIRPDGKTLYVVDNADNAVTPIDLTARRALPPIPVGVSPMLIAVAPGGNLAYVSNYANSTITPIDLANGRAEHPVQVGGAPYGVAFTGDGTRAVVVARRDNACSIVDVATGSAGPPIALGNGPYTIAVP
jgi:predicted alpha-1,2-mannosidase